MQSPLITDSQSLVSATYKGLPLRVYDDGFGPLFIFSQSLGPIGIVRATNWEEAWEICEDEFFDETDETREELIAKYNFTRKSVKIIRDANAPNGERKASAFDYVDGKLPLELFLRWDTIETKIDPNEEQVWMDNELFQEAYGFRPNGPNSRDVHKHGIYQKDLNGDHLQQLTQSLISELKISLEIKDETL